MISYADKRGLWQLRPREIALLGNQNHTLQKLRSLRGTVPKAIMYIQIKDVKKVYDINGWYEQLYGK